MSTVVTIPPGFKELLQEFSIAVLRGNPDNVVDFAVEYFTELRNSRESANGEDVSKSADEEEDSDEPIAEPPPPRRGPRRVAVAGESFDPEKEDDADAEPIPTYPKTEEQRERLAAAVNHILLFRCLDEDQLRNVIDAMFERNVQPGDTIINQGEDGDNFYVIESGVYDIFVLIDGVNTKVGEYDNKGSFGELALMYNAPRAATITGAQSGTVWAMSRDTFRRLVLKKAFQKRVMYEALLDNVPMLKELAPYERMNVADALRTRTFEAGATVLHEGEPGEEMFFIEEGEVLITRGDVELTQLQKGGYFGELALLTQQPRAATARATSRTKVAVLDVGSFERLLGPCLDIMRRSIGDYQAQLEAIFGSAEAVPQLRAH